LIAGPAVKPIAEIRIDLIVPALTGGGDGRRCGYLPIK
jgi:hypothetical protein